MARAVGQGVAAWVVLDVVLRPGPQKSTTPRNNHKRLLGLLLAIAVVQLILNVLR